MKPGGKVAILVPAHKALYGKLDERYHHLRRYSRRDVRELFRKAGVELEMVRYFNPVGAIGWLVFVRLMRRTRLTRAGVVLTEKVGVPVGRFLERFGIHPFGQSVIGVGRRPSAG